MIDAKIADLVDRTITKIHVSEDKEVMVFHMADGDKYKMYHSHDCCEDVQIEDIAGDLNDLIGSPILKAEERSNSTRDDEGYQGDGSSTWTFYELATFKGYVTIRWLGSSNGYYSESVQFDKIGIGDVVAM